MKVEYHYEAEITCCAECPFIKCEYERENCETLDYCGLLSYEPIIHNKYEEKIRNDCPFKKENHLSAIKKDAKYAPYLFYPENVTRRSLKLKCR